MEETIKITEDTLSNGIKIVVDSLNRTLQGDGEAINVATEVAQSIDEQSYDVWDNLFDPLNTTFGEEQIHGAIDIEIKAVVTSLKFNAILFFGVLLLYEFMAKTFPSVYFANKKNLESGIVLPKTDMPLAWLFPILRISWSQVRKLCGMDGYFFLRYIRMCFQITAVTGLWGILLLWPIYAAGGNDAHGWYHLSMSNISSGSWMLWVPTGFVWLLTFYVMFTMNEEYKHWVECRQEFLAKGESHVHPQQNYSLQVEEIPNDLRSERALREYFEQLFPNKVHSTSLVLNSPDLNELWHRRDRVCRRLEKCNAILEIASKRPVHKVGVHAIFDLSRRASCPPGRKVIDLHETDSRLPTTGERVDSINYFTKYLAILNEKMVEAQKEYSNRALDGDKNSKRASEWISQTLGFNKGGLELTRAATEDGDVLLTTSTRNLNLKEGAATVVSKLGFDFVIGAISSLHKPFDAVVDSVLGSTLTSTGFVTFTDLVTLTCAVRAPLSHEAGVLHARNAPDPRDIVWENAHVNETFMIHREWMANALLGVGAILWSVPVTAIQAMANLSQLARIPGLTWVSKAAHGDFGAFLNGYLPVLALIILITVLPFIFEWIALKYEQRKKQSDVQHSILKRFFNYQLANVYITVTAGSILDSLAEILDHPSNLLSLLAKSVPTVVGYFVMFVSTKLLAGLPVSLLQVGPLLNRVMSLMFCRDRILTQRELDEAYAPLPFELGREYANQLLIIVIMFTYATISPVILPVGAMYFLGALLVYKKQLLLVFSPAYESGGMMFPTSCQRTLIGLICGQLTLLGYTVLRRGFYQPMVLLPLPFYTLSMMNSFKKLYEEPGRYLSLERAIHLDQKSAKEAQFDRNVYRQPSMREGDLEPQPYRRKKGSSHVSEDVILEPSADKAV